MDHLGPYVNPRACPRLGSCRRPRIEDLMGPGSTEIYPTCLCVYLVGRSHWRKTTGNIITCLKFSHLQDFLLKDRESLCYDVILFKSANFLCILYSGLCHFYINSQTQVIPILLISFYLQIPKQICSFSVFAWIFKSHI